MVSLKGNPETMIATLGVEPQVITIALDSLIKQGKYINEVTVLYTGISRCTARFSIALARSSSYFCVKALTSSAHLLLRTRCPLVERV
jgi:hypothetical protein